MEQIKRRAAGKFAKGSVFQGQLPGYFGSVSSTGAVFIPEEKNRSLPHPHDNGDLICSLLTATAYDKTGSKGRNQARSILETLAEKDPGNPTVLFWLGRVLREIGEKESNPLMIAKASERFSQALAIDPANSDFFHMKMWSLLQLGYFAKVKNDIEAWREKNGTVAKTLELLGYLYISTKNNRISNPFFDVAKGFSAFENSLVLNPNNPRLILILIDQCEKLNKVDGKEKYLRMYKDLESKGWL